jgi:hypothetical protein
MEKNISLLLIVPPKDLARPAIAGGEANDPTASRKIFVCQ